MKIHDFQKHCCCKAWDARRCYRLRNPGEDSDEECANGEECSCACHSEIDAWNRDSEDDE